MVPKDYPPAGPLGSTDPLQWRLSSDDAGRHVWYYLDKSGEISSNEIAGKGPDREQTAEDKYWLGLPTDAPTLEDPKGNPQKAAQNGFTFLKTLQSADGHWAAEYGGPLFLIPGIIIACYVTKTPIPDEWKIELSRYLSNCQRDNGLEDSGWGLHIAGKSTVFGTSLNYVVLRILGVDAEHPMMVRARATLHALGGAVGNPAWGKFWLSLLNVYDWQGNNPWPPELWLLPTFIPIHPSKWWIHCRNVMIPMCFLSAHKFKAAEDEMILSLRNELYTEPYEEINWPQHRNNTAKADLFTPHTAILNMSFEALKVWDSYFCPSFIRKKGLDTVYKLIVQEDENTSYQCLAPVNKPMQMVCRYVMEGEGSEALRLHREKLRDFVWMTDEGALVCGTNGSQLWDTSFIASALCESGLAEKEENRDSVCNLLAWIDQCQIRDDPKHYECAYRHGSKGGWPFSTREQGYPVSDCTAEGLKAVLETQALEYTPKGVSDRRLFDAVDLILSFQNKDGSYASYELIRGPEWTEMFNAAEVFRRIMIEYSYPECTTSCLTAIAKFHKVYPDYRKEDVKKMMSKAAKYIHASQRSDGSWYGSWAVCFTYATMFAVESLEAVGETYENSSAMRKACAFLLAKQREDGGWGETFESCVKMKYIQHDESQVSQTSWALLALLRAKCPDHAAIRRGCRLIMSKQNADGSWKNEDILGMFNKTVTISYPLYKFSFSIWALGKAYQELGSEGWGADEEK